MRIIIDMQGAQTESRFRGIGRYTLSFAQAVIRNKGEHEVMLALSGLFPETIDPIRAAFEGTLPQEKIRVWRVPASVSQVDMANARRRRVAELAREAFLASLEPSVIHLTSLFEGYMDDAVTSIGLFDKRTPVTVSLYDLIPLLNPDQYLTPNPTYQLYYEEKIEYLKRASGYLAISEFAKQEGKEHLNRPDSLFFNVSTATDPCFQSLHIDEQTAEELRNKFGLTRRFVLYTGGADDRKNLPRLMRAFAGLPGILRADHQLLFAGKMPRDSVIQLECLAQSLGFKSDELCFTGFISDAELVQLYNLCQLFIFPSWHEGFGLPALEAMACGAPVIGANSSSLPEVIDLDAALFDPRDVDAITGKMRCALEDETFRNDLRKHGLQQAKRFSWDETAKLAVSAWEQRDSSSKIPLVAEASFGRSQLNDAVAGQLLKKDKVYITHLAACLAQNQLAGTQRQLFVDISEFCQSDAATGVQRVVRSYLQALLNSPPAGFSVEPVYATRDEGYRYAKKFTQQFREQHTDKVCDEPIRWQRGDVFFGLDMQHHIQLAQAFFYRHMRADGVVVKFLVYDLLPIQLVHLFKDTEVKDLHERFLAMVASMDGAICISKATADAYECWIDENGIYKTPNFQMAWQHIGADLEGSKPSLGLPADAGSVLEAMRSRPSFLAVSTLEPRKGQQQIVDALQLVWDEGVDVNLVLVGKQGWKTEELAEALRGHAENGRHLFWLEGISDEYLKKIYARSTCLVAASINEGFGLPLIEAARHGVPIIARDIPVFREVTGDNAYYFSGQTGRELAEHLKEWLSLHRAGKAPKSSGLSWLTWQQSAERLKTALTDHHYSRRQLLVDVSELVQRDARTGIQRVVRNILTEWLRNPPAGYRVEPVYASLHQGYRYARDFSKSFLSDPGRSGEDCLIDYGPGDVFLGLDFQPQVAFAQRHYYQEMRRQGVRVLFTVYDLLCIQMPETFPPGTREGFSQWLTVVAESDGALCISNAVADELTEWVKNNGSDRERSFLIDWFHLGADVENATLIGTLPPEDESVLERLCSRRSFLMVGTLESRKGHNQVLLAFDELWARGIDVNLVFVGKQGWMVESLITKVRGHAELGSRLFWLEGISDNYLDRIYKACSCLIAASMGEGFGLPLIEAAHHRLPIIARDLPVFREVAGEHAYFFTGKSADDLATAIEQWLKLYGEQLHPTSSTMPWLTWKESAERLLAIVLDREGIVLEEGTLTVDPAQLNAKLSQRSNPI